MFKNAFRACGLCPLDPESVDYNKVLKKDITIQPHSNDHNFFPTNENPDLVKHLKYLESYTNKHTLKTFYALKGGEWNGHEEDRSLYLVWRLMSQESGLTYPPECENNYDNQDIIIDIEENIMLESGWEQNLLMETTAGASKINILRIDNLNDLPINKASLLPNNDEGIENIVEGTVGSLPEKDIVDLKGTEVKSLEIMQIYN